MTRREQLQERYEDALFALLMDEVATFEGKKALEENERLKRDPGAEVPAEVSRQCVHTIRNHFALQKARAAGRFTVKAFGKVATAAGIAAILFTGAFAASDTFRASTLNLVVEIFDESTDFRLGAGTPAGAHRISAGWLPEGHTLEGEGSDNAGKWYHYQNAADASFYIIYTVAEGTVLSVDTENAETQSIQVQGQQAMLILKGDTVQIVWTLPDNSAFMQLIGTGMMSDDLIRVANEIKY